MTSVLINIDVPELTAAIDFYTHAFDLHVFRRFEGFAELRGAPCPIYLLETAPGSAPYARAKIPRDFARHWTPIHLDFVVEDLPQALARALNAGAEQQGPVRDEPYGRIVSLSDPFGHGVCLLEPSERGYDALPRAE